MKKLAQYIHEKLRDHNIFIERQLSIGNQGNELYYYFDGKVPPKLEEMFISGHELSEVMLEHLRNIDSKYILKDLKEYFDWCYDIEEDEQHELITLEAKRNPRKDKDFIKLLDIYQYSIKSSFKNFDGPYSVVLEKNFPEDVTERVHIENRHRYVFHITSRRAADIIKEKGLRPGFHYDDPRNVNKQVWKQYKESHDKEKWNKNYFFYVPGFYMDNESLSKVKEMAREIASPLRKLEDPVLLCIHLPEETRVYADKSMPMENCCFTFSKIHPNCIGEIKGTFKR